MKFNNRSICLLVLGTLFSFLLVGCASQTAYEAAENGGYGYSQSKFTNNQYRVNFKAKGSDKEKAMDYAMLRAAELTLQNNYQWFEVVERETLIDEEEIEPQVNFSNRYAVVRDCGLVACRTTYFPQSNFATGVFIGGSEKSTVDVSLQIRMRNGTKPDEAFVASQVRDNLIPKTEKEESKAS